MSVLFIALPVALLLGAAALVACVRCIRGGQFDDLETPAVRMLIDDVPERPSAGAATARSGQPPHPDDPKNVEHASRRQSTAASQSILGRMP